MPRHRQLASLLVLALMTGLVGIPAPARAGATCFGKAATIIGTGGSDRLVGTPGTDVIVGLGGNDVILGREGNDRICGRDGLDALLGGPGSDRIAGGLGSESSILGGRGNDVLIGGRGPDEIGGGAGNDTINGGSGWDFLRGAWGHDLIRGGSGSDYLLGMRGNDSLQGDEGSDVLFGHSGDDTFAGGTGYDHVAFGDLSLNGVNANLETGVATGQGDDTIVGVEALWGTGGDDILTGDEGDNFLLGFDGDDALVGGDGSDEVSFISSNDAVNVDLATGQATGQGTDTLSGIEDLQGTDFADTLNGDDNDNVLVGWRGTDTGDARGHVDGDTCISIENPSNCETIEPGPLSTSDLRTRMIWMFATESRLTSLGEKGRITSTTSS